MVATLNYTYVRGANYLKHGLPTIQLDADYHVGAETADLATAVTTTAAPGKGQVILTPDGGDIRVNIGASGVAAPTAATGTFLKDGVTYTFDVNESDVIKAIDQ